MANLKQLEGNGIPERLFRGKQIPKAVIKRLSLYARALQIMSVNRIERISSRELGEALAINPAQVRKDLAYFGQFGVPVGVHLVHAGPGSAQRTSESTSERYRTDPTLGVRSSASLVSLHAGLTPDNRALCELGVVVATSPVMLWVASGRTVYLPIGPCRLRQGAAVSVEYREFGAACWSASRL